jgi:hypothetical protein
MNPIPKVQDLERARGVTWGELVELEPRLNELLWQARAAGAGCRCREDAYRAFAPYRGALAELIGLRGRHRDHPVLGSVGAYQVAYGRLREAVSPIPRAGMPDGIADVAAFPASDASRWLTGQRLEASSGAHR